MKFAWEPIKADVNGQNYGVGFDEASTVFGDPLDGTFPSSDHFIGKLAYPFPMYMVSGPDILKLDVYHRKLNIGW